MFIIPRGKCYGQSLRVVHQLVVRFGLRNSLDGVMELKGSWADLSILAGARATAYGWQRSIVLTRPLAIASVPGFSELLLTELLTDAHCSRCSERPVVFLFERGR